MLTPTQKYLVFVCVTAVLALAILFAVRAAAPTAPANTNETNSTTSVTDDNDTLPQSSTIYVSIVTHNEEPNGTAAHPDFTKDEAEFWRQRDAVVALANMLYENQVGYNWQSDWNFLLAATMFDNGTPSTNGKNIVRYLSEDLGMSIGPHAHETEYTYADVAALIAELGVTPNGVVGGFLISPPFRSKLEYLRDPIRGNIYDYTWTPTILWGGGSPSHRADPEISGVWRPMNTKNYYTHDENGSLPDVGTYFSTWEGIDELLALQAAGKLTPGLIYTSSVMISQELVTDIDALNNIQAQIDALKDEVAAGLVVFADIETVVKIWEEQYNGVPNIYRTESSTTR